MCIKDSLTLHGTSNSKLTTIDYEQNSPHKTINQNNKWHFNPSLSRSALLLLRDCYDVRFTFAERLDY